MHEATVLSISTVYRGLYLLFVKLYMVVVTWLAGRHVFVCSHEENSERSGIGYNG